MSLRTIHVSLYTAAGAAWILLIRTHEAMRRMLMIMPMAHGNRRVMLVSMMASKGQLVAHPNAQMLLMTVAMMLPAAIPAAAFVGANTLKTRRAHSVVLFLISYFSIWIAFLALALTAIRALVPSGPVTTAGIGALAAIWQVLPTKRTALRACHRATRLPVLGWRALTGCLEFGGRHGLACVASCGALMLVPLPTAITMVPVAGYVWLERHRRPSRAVRYASAIGILGLAALTLAT